MSNNYTQSSVEFKVPRKAVDWVNKVLRLEFEHDWAELGEELGFTNEDQLSNTESWPGFRTEWEVRDSQPYLYVFHDENIDLEHVEVFVTALLRRFDPDGTVVLEVAETCDRPRPGQFGGGFMIITKDQTLGGNSAPICMDTLKAREPTYQVPALGFWPGPHVARVYKQGDAWFMERFGEWHQCEDPPTHVAAIPGRGMRWKVAR